MIERGPLVVGVDVGGTNTDSVLLNISREGASAVIASHKAPTTSDVTSSVESTLQSLLDSAETDRADIAALVIGTTHFLNAIIEKDSSRVERVAVIRLASHDFSNGVPPFCDWPAALKRLIAGHWAIMQGGVNLDGKPLSPIDVIAVRREAGIIRSKGLKNVAVVGIGSPMDDECFQEKQVAEILAELLDPSVNIVCSKDVAGQGLLARENASILNASILNFARRTIRSFKAAMERARLRCPLYLTTNAGHLMRAEEALKLPIQIFSSGATNSIRGAALLAGSAISRSGCVVVDIGGTTTDVGYVMRNGFPRLSKTHADLAGVRVNLEIPSVESIGLGGGSLVHASLEGGVRIGPASVGHELTTKSLCFGGEITTATDVAVASGARIGRANAVSLDSTIVSAARLRIKSMLENAIDHVKLFPEPCAVILVGGGNIILPPNTRLIGVAEVVIPEHANVANAVGAAMARIRGSAEMMVDVDQVDTAIGTMKTKAIADAVAKGAIASSVTVLNEEVNWVPYSEAHRQVKVEVACPPDHRRIYEDIRSGKVALEDTVQSDGAFEESLHHVHLGVSKRDSGEADTESIREVDLDDYRPQIQLDGRWNLSQMDIKFIEIGSYILGCGGGGSPYSAWLHLRQLLSEGETVTIVRIEDVDDDDVIPPVAGIGTPAVGLERPGGLGVMQAVDLMARTLDVEFNKLLATEIGGGNGLGTLIWGSTRYYNIPIVDGDLMGRAYPNFEMVSTYVDAKSVNELLPVTICSGTGQSAVISAHQNDEAAAGIEIRRVCASMGFAAGAAGNPLTGRRLRNCGIPNTFSLSWRLGRAICKANRSKSTKRVPEAIIAEVGGPGSAQCLFTGKIRGVRSKITATAHSLGEVVIERLAGDEIENDFEMIPEHGEVIVPFMNENLAVIRRTEDGEEQVLATVPDLIFLLDTSTGEAIGTQEYRYGVKVTVMVMAPHPIWTSPRGLEIVGPDTAFHLPYKYHSTLTYTKPISVIDEFKPTAWA